jgi:hypothetical protein
MIGSGLRSTPRGEAAKEAKKSREFAIEPKSNKLSRVVAKDTFFKILFAHFAVSLLRVNPNQSAPEHKSTLNVQSLAISRRSI